MNGRQKCIKIPKKPNKIKIPYITCSHIWHDDKSKYMYWSDTHFLKVWWKYVLPNTHFCDTFFRYRTVLPDKKISKIKNPASLGITRIIYHNFSKYFIALHKLEAVHRVQTTDRIPEFPTGRHFLHLSETCLYMVHFSLGSFFGNRKKMST